MIETSTCPTRQAAVANALQATNKRAAIPEHDFASLLPRPPRGSQWDLARMFRIVQLGDGKIRTEGVSTCGLVAAQLLSHTLSLPWGNAYYWEYPSPFTRLDIVSCLGKLGDVYGAKRRLDERPRPGDVACVGGGYATHVLTVIDDDGTNVWSVDGGQVDDAEHGFLQRTRTCKRQWDAMRLVWVLNLDALAGKLGKTRVTVPEGYESVIVPPAPVVAKSWALGTTRGQQAALLMLGWNLNVDGIRGPKTIAAIKDFQTACGLTVDGIVGAKTSAAMRARLP